MIRRHGTEPRSGTVLPVRLAVSAALLVAPVRGGDALAQGAAMAPGHHMGASIMPFDLDRTLHIFTPLPDGGIQDVVSLDGDARQVALIRGYLRDQARLRDRGDYGAPAAMHGADMPGLAALSGGAGRLRVGFEALPDGARLRYATRDPALVRAVHAWFAAQARDHGADAMLSHQ